MTFSLREEMGPVLVGRSEGVALRERIEAAVRSGESVVLDFDGVTLISPSFADEVFAKLLVEVPEAGEKLEFENLNENLQRLARFSIAQRSRS